MKKLSVFAIILAMTTLSFAQAGAGRGMGQNYGSGNAVGMGQGQGGVVFQSLDDAQKSALGDARSAHDKDVIPLRADMKVARIEYHELIADGADRKKIDKKQSEISSLQTKLGKLRTDHLLKVRDIVGEDNFKNMHAGNRGMRGGRNMGPGDCGQPMNKRSSRGGFFNRR